LATYLRLLFIPYPLSVYYSPWKLVSFFQGDVLLAACIIVLVASILWRWRKEELIAPLLIGIVVLLAPVAFKANEMVLGSDRAFIAERQLYVPAILFALLVAAVISRLRNKYLWTSFIAVIPVFVFLSNSTAAVWINSDSLTTKFKMSHPDSTISHMTIANALMENNDPDGALAEYKKAFPSFKVKQLTKNKIMSGNATDKKSKNLADLLDKYDLAAYQPEFAIIHYNIGRALLAKNNQEEAIRKFKTVLVLQPHFVEARIALARIYVKKGLFHDASREYRLALKDIEVFRRS
jgi:hypothetical protein